ncbi:MAG: DUF5723 family protein [Chitinophagales bacterium]
MLLIQFSIVSIANAQEPIGLMNDNYLPASAIMFNPASLFTSTLPGDLNIVSGDITASNNLAYTNNFSLLTLSSPNISNNKVAFNTPSTIRSFSNALIEGPSAVIRHNSLSYGIITRTQSAASLMTGQVDSNLNFNHIAKDTLYQFPQSRTAGMKWTEVGFNLGKCFNRYGAVRVSMAVNINYVAGWDGISAVTQQPLYFVKNSEASTMSFKDVIMNYGYTSGFSSDVSHVISSFQLKGSGAGTDAGVWIAGGADPSHYRWKAGISMIDVGFVSFSKNVTRYQITTDTTITATVNDFNTLNSAGAFTQIATQAVEGKGTMIQESGPLVIALPAALVLQAEVAMPENLFLHALLVQRMILSQQQVLRANCFAVTPRYEIKNFAAGIPVNWYDNNRVQVGGYIRIGPVIAGSDNLAALFVPSKWQGADFYFGIHAHPFKDHPYSSYHNKSGKIGCPKF